MRLTLVALVCSLTACAGFKQGMRQAKGRIVVSVENTTPLSGFEVFINGHLEARLDADQQTTVLLWRWQTDVVRLVVRHPELTSDLTVSFFVSSFAGLGNRKASFSLSTEKRDGDVGLILLPTKFDKDLIFVTKDKTPSDDS